jgi:transcriptional regulator with XRE-family HTH domain
LKLPGLKEARELRGWSQQRLAEESGVSRDGISNYETGQRDAWPATASRLAEALGVEIEDLALPKVIAPSTSGQPVPTTVQMQSAKLAAEGRPTTIIVDLQRLENLLRQLGEPESRMDATIRSLEVAA